MKPFLLISSVVLIVSFAYSASSTSGSVELDELSFDKIIKKFQVSLVKFDVAFPFGDKHEAFLALAKDAKDMDDLLIAEVGVKDYGEKDNEALAKKYGASKENFPVVKLFMKGKSEPLTFDDSKEFSSDELRRFIRENTGVYLSLPGCVKEFDKLAMEFMKADKDSRKKFLKKAEELEDKLTDKDKSSGKIYKTIMQKILEKGDEFVDSEHSRVKKVLNSKVSDEKKREIRIRINILQTFLLNDKKNQVEKEEL